MLPRLVSAALAIALLTSVRPAHADASADFKNGTSVTVRIASVSVGPATMTTGGRAISKPRGTLDIAIAAGDLGVQVPATLHLHGTSLGGGHLMFAIDDTISPPLALGGGQSLTRITGQLYAYASRIPGAASQVGSVKIAFPNSSYLLAYGTWGTLRIDLTNTAFIGGELQPPLEAFVNKGDLFVCSDVVETTQPLAVWLAGAAQGGDAGVDLESSSSGIRLPNGVGVHAGRRSTLVTAHIARNFVGPVWLTAAAGGVKRSLDVTVHPHRDCDAGPSTGPSAQPWVPSTVAGCTNCTSHVDIEHDNDKLTTINGRLQLIRGTSKTDLLAAFPGATALTAVAMTNDDMITGRITIGGTAQAFRADMKHGAPTPVLLGAMTPTAINNFEVVVGSSIVSGANQAVFTNGAGIVPLSLQSSFGVRASQALDIADSGQIVGTYTDTASVVRGFRWFRNITTTLPVLGVKPAIPVGVNSVGQIAVNGANSAGQPLAAIVSPTGALAQLGVPSGYATFEAKSINQFGAIVGIAKTTGTSPVQRAFVWRAGRGFTALTSYVPNLIATDALRITDANQVVVRGTLAGVADLYLVTL